MAVKLVLLAACLAPSLASHQWEKALRKGEQGEIVMRVVKSSEKGNPHDDNQEAQVFDVTVPDTVPGATKWASTGDAVLYMREKNGLPHMNSKNDAMLYNDGKVEADNDEGPESAFLETEKEKKKKKKKAIFNPIGYEFAVYSYKGAKKVNEAVTQTQSGVADATASAFAWHPFAKPTAEYAKAGYGFAGKVRDVALDISFFPVSAMAKDKDADLEKNEVDWLSWEQTKKVLNLKGDSLGSFWSKSDQELPQDLEVQKAVPKVPFAWNPWMANPWTAPLSAWGGAKASKMFQPPAAAQQVEHKQQKKVVDPRKVQHKKVDPRKLKKVDPRKQKHKDLEKEAAPFLWWGMDSDGFYTAAKGMNKAHETAVNTVADSTASVFPWTAWGAAWTKGAEKVRSGVTEAAIDGHQAVTKAVVDFWVPSSK